MGQPTKRANVHFSRSLSDFQNRELRLEFKSKCPCQQPELSRFSARGLKPTRRLENVRGEEPNHAPIALRLASTFRGNKSNQFGNSGVLRLSYLQLLFIRTASPLELPEHQCIRNVDKDLERREDLREPQNSQPQTAFAICLHLRPMVGQHRSATVPRSLMR